MSRLKWSKRNRLDVARDFSQRGRTYLYSEIEPKKETTMDCGMCGEKVAVTTDLMPHLNDGVMCIECEEGVMVAFPGMPDVVVAEPEGLDEFLGL